MSYDFSGVVIAAQWMADGDHVASASWDRTVKLWDAETTQCVATLTGECSPDHILSRLLCLALATNMYPCVTLKVGQWLVPVGDVSSLPENCLMIDSLYTYLCCTHMRVV